jgi:hypothetical protein
MKDRGRSDWWGPQNFRPSRNASVSGAKRQQVASACALFFNENHLVYALYLYLTSLLWPYLLAETHSAFEVHIKHFGCVPLTLYAHEHNDYNYDQWLQFYQAPHQDLTHPGFPPSQRLLSPSIRGCRKTSMTMTASRISPMSLPLQLRSLALGRTPSTLNICPLRMILASGHHFERCGVSLDFNSHSRFDWQPCLELIAGASLWRVDDCRSFGQYSKPYV